MIEETDIGENTAVLTAESAPAAEASAVGGHEEEAMAQSLMETHRAALSRMRAAAAIDMLIAASGAKDAEVVRRLLDVDCTALAASEDAYGVPDTQAVREKLSHLHRDCGYLFHAGQIAYQPQPKQSSAGTGSATGGSGLLADDPNRMSDDDYYRTYFKK